MCVVIKFKFAENMGKKILNSTGAVENSLFSQHRTSEKSNVQPHRLNNALKELTISLWCAAVA